MLVFVVVCGRPGERFVRLASRFSQAGKAYLVKVHSHATLVDLLEAGETEAAAAELERHLDEAESSMLTALDLN